MYLLDINVLMHLANRADGHLNIREHLKACRKSDVALSAITATEIWIKTLNNKASKRGRDEVQAVFNAFKVLPFKADASFYGALVVIECKEKGKPIGWPDNMLAAHALALDATVVTNNTKDFSRSGCKLVDWTRPV